MRDPNLTVVYYTASVLREPFFSNAQKQLTQAAGRLPIISISQKPLALGENICVELGRSYLNIYKQMLIGAKAAKTKYIAFAEDDTLYSAEHFRTYMPKDDEFAFDVSRWSLYTWSSPPVFSIKSRRSNSTLIAVRDLFIEAMEERFAKFPDESQIKLKNWAEPSRYESHLGVTVRTGFEFSSDVPCITFSHPDAIGYDIQGELKALGKMKAYEIPYWGRASDVMERFYGLHVPVQSGNDGKSCSVAD